MRSKKRSQRTLVWCLVMFAFGQATWSFVAEREPKLRDPSYGDKLAKLQRRLHQFPDRPLVLMLGSSRTGYALDGLSAEARLYDAHGGRAIVFNFGVPAAGPVTHLLYLRRLLNAGVVPDVLIVEVMPALLHDDDGKALERRYFEPERFFADEAAFAAKFGYDEAAAVKARLSSLALPADRLRFPMLTRIAPSSLPWQVRYDWSRGADACGWNRIQHPNVTDEARARWTAAARGEYAATLRGLNMRSAALRALAEIRELCEERSIPAAYVLLPEGSEFRSLYSDESLSPLIELLDDGLFDLRDGLDDRHFADSHHPLPDGSAKFTRRLIDEVVAPRWTAKGRNR